MKTHFSVPGVNFYIINARETGSANVFLCFPLNGTFNMCVLAYN